MIDYFTLLGQARRPWLDPSGLREKFLALSADLHPDRVHDQGDAARQAAHDRYATLNAAYQSLREPKDRLRHLISLERGGPPEELQRVEAGVLELFAGVNEVCRSADRVLQEKRTIASPLLQVQWYARAQETRERLQQTGRELSQRLERLDEELKQADADWEKTGPGDRHPLLERLEALYRLYGFLNRWTSQVQGRMLQLDL